MTSERLCFVLPLREVKYNNSSFESQWVTYLRLTESPSSLSARVYLSTLPSYRVHFQQRMIKGFDWIITEACSEVVGPWKWRLWR